MLKEKLGLCPYEVICDEEEFILMPEIRDNKEPKKIKISEEPKKIKISEEPKKIKISEKPKKINIPEELIEINIPKDDENMTGWFHKNKFEKILATVNSDKFSHKNKIGKLR